MIKTVIIDDEVWAIKLIKNIVNWEELGYCIVGEADNSEDAVKLIAETSPQLLVTDIRMPGNNGIYLMQQAKDMMPDMDIIVISGYDEFEYAKKAMDYGAYSYLLKPVDRTELTDVLLKLRNKINSNEQNRIVQQEKLEQHQEERRHQLLRDIMQGAITKKENLKDININYCTGFCEGKYTVLMCKLIARNDEALNAAKQAELEQKLYSIIEERLMPICAEVIKAKTASGMLVLLNYGKKQRNVSDKINEVHKVFARQYLLSGDYRLIIGKSTEKKGFNEISDAFNEASFAILQRIYSENAAVIAYSSEYGKRSSRKIISAGEERRLRSYIELCDVDDTKLILQELLMPHERLNPVDVFCTANLVVNILFQTWRPQSELIEEIGVRREQVESRIDNALSINEIISVFTEVIEKVKQLIFNMQKSQPERIADKVKRYIHQHYNEKLTLETICGSIYLSPPYVCAAFKQAEGMTVLEYITDYRMAIAKELLLDNQYQVSDVMMMVGYSDPKYFVKVFKKKTGITPSEYRKIFL